MFVARDDEGAEAEAASPFDDFAGAIDEDNLFGQFIPGLSIGAHFRRLGRRTATAATAAGAASATAISSCWFRHCDISWLD
jgi:hypothetical protein